MAVEGSRLPEEAGGEARGWRRVDVDTYEGILIRELGLPR